MACKLTYNNEIFDTEEDLLEYARKNNIKEILSAFDDSNTYYQADQLKSDSKVAAVKELVDKGLINEKPDMSNNRRYYIKDLSNRGEINLILGKHGLRDEAKIFGDTVQFYFQPTDNTISSKASAKTIARVSEFLKRIGVDVRIMNNLNINGTELGANGVADVLNKLISIAEGKEDVALTEEAMHFAVELLEQTKSPLFEKMMKDVGTYNLYRATLAQYSSIYKTKEGKPDIRKIKKEALAKILTEHVIKLSEGTTEKPELITQTKSWWRQFIDWLNTLIGKAGFNPFVEAAEVVVKDLSGDVKGDELFLQATPASTVFDNLVAKAAQIKKIETPNSEGGTDSYYEIGGKRVTKRVTDRSKAYEEGLFKNKQVTPEQEKMWNYKKEKGTAGHKDIENIFKRYIDPTTGLRRVTPLEKGVSEIDPDNSAMYNTLESNFVDRINSFPAGTRFMSEVMIYDEVNDEAGTIDFIAITPDGKLSIYDWKFMDIDIKKTSDIPWYKKRAFNIQLGAYKNILSKRYGVKDYGQVRVIPIKATYNLTGPKGSKTLKLGKVQIGSVNVKEIEQDYLLPFALEGESTGNPEIDSLIEKLNAVLAKIEARSANKGEQFERIEQMNTLLSAIRRLQIKGDASVLADQGLGLIKRYQDLIKRYNSTFEGKDPKDISPEDQEMMSEELFDAHSILDVYTDIDVILAPSFKKEDADLVEKLQDLSSNARLLKKQVENVSKKLTNDFVAKGVGVNNLLTPEKSVSYVKKMFRSFSQAQTAATRTLYKLIDPILQKTNIQFLEETKKLEKLKTRMEEWAKSKGIKDKDMFKQLMQFDEKGRWTGKLIDKVNRQFYAEFDEARDSGDKKWFEENIDLDEYRKWVKPYLENRIAKIKEGRYLADDEANAKKQEELIEKVEKEFDIDNYASAYGNWRMRQLGLESKWISKEYANIKAKGNEPPSEFYNYMQDKLKKSYELGLLKAWQYRTFVPNIRTSALERTVFGGKTHTSWIERNLAANPDDQIYGHKDPLTGEVIDTIGAWYINDLGVKTADPNGEEFTDYSEKSQDLFRVFSLWNEQITKYEYLTNVENRVRLLHMTEGLKKSIETNKFGSPMRERDASGKIVADKLIEIENNETNQEYLKSFIDYYMFGKNYKDAASLDIMIPNVVNKFAETINKKAGRELITPMKADGTLSLAKIIQSLNQFFQMKVLGLNVATSLSNLAGGSLNSAINAGRYFTKTDLAVGFSKIGETRFWGNKDSNVLAALLDKVSPLLDNIKLEAARQLSVSGAVEHLSSDWLFKLQRNSDKVVQYPIAIAAIMNSTIVDGKIVNIRELVRKNNGYDKIYDLPVAEREQLKAKIEKEILDMKNNNSILNQAKIIDDQLELPGVDLDELAKFRSFIQQISKDAVGNSTREDINQIRLSLIGQSLMMFKNWIPRLVDVRFSELRYNVGTDNYEYGRARMFMKALSLNIFKSIANLQAITSGSEKGIEFIKDIYNKKKLEFEESGEEFNMTEQEFIDMYIKGVKAEMKELGILMGLFSMFLFMKAHAPDDDDRAKGFWKWSTRLSDKITDELAFFYSPSSIAQIANGSLFPSLGALTDIQKVVQHVSKEAFGFAVSATGISEEIGDKAQENAKPLKYIFKTFPATKEALTWIAVMNKEMGDDLGLQLSTESRVNR